MTKPTIESVSKTLVINEKQEALILTIGEYKEKPERSFTPDLPGGLVDPGETSLVAVQRELIEETGISVDASLFELAYTGTEYFASNNKSVTKFLYILQLDSTPEVTVSWEHDSYNWVPLEGLPDTVKLRPFYDEAVRYVLTNELV